MIEAIRKAALGAVEAGAPVAVVFGSVINTDPLEVNVDQRFTLDADFLIVPDGLVRQELDLSGIGLEQPVVIHKGLEVGNSVILLRVQGGQKYLILDKVASI